MVRPLIHRDELDQSLGVDPFAYARRTGRDDLEKKFERAAAALPRGDDGGIDPAVLQDRVCPLCGEIESDQWFVKYGFPIHRCRTCGFVFARLMPAPVFSESDAGRQWQAAMSVDHLAFITQPFYRQCAAKRFEFELQQILRWVPESVTPQHFLEVGASIGIGLTVARAYGLVPVGVEPDAEAYALAAQCDAEVHHAYFPTAALPADHFDIVMSLDVLEHIGDPVGFLQEMGKILKPGGLVGIQIPNAGALISRLEGRDNQIYNGLIHLNYFDPESLDQAAEIAGLERVHTFTFLSELGKCRAHDPEKVAAIVREVAPHRDPLQPLHQDWINDEGLGYKVFGIYRRPDF